jgi:uncharacterized membrane protein YqaE (UPF0057 family)
VNILRVILAVIVPPLGVFLKVGFGLQFWLNILLTFLGYIPGLIHAIWIIARDKRRTPGSVDAFGEGFTELAI